MPRLQFSFFLSHYERFDIVTRISLHNIHTIVKRILISISWVTLCCKYIHCTILNVSNIWYRKYFHNYFVQYYEICAGDLNLHSNLIQLNFHALSFINIVSVIVIDNGHSIKFFLLFQWTNQNLVDCQQ